MKLPVSISSVIYFVYILYIFVYIYTPSNPFRLYFGEELMERYLREVIGN